MHVPDAQGDARWVHNARRKHYLDIDSVKDCTEPAFWGISPNLHEESHCGENYAAMVDILHSKALVNHLIYTEKGGHQHLITQIHSS